MVEEKLTIFAKKEDKKMFKVHETFAKSAKGLMLFSPQDAPIPVPKKYQLFVADDFRDKTRMKGLVDSYLSVFGSGDIWGEGATCSDCNHVVSLEEYEATGKGDGCRCGGKFSPFYDQEELEERIKEELNPSDYDDPFCMVMQNEESPERIDGFCWGVIDTAERIAERITINRYKEDQKTGEEVKEKILKGLSEAGRYLFFDELGVRKEARGGIGPVVYLTRLGFEKARENNANGALFWTAKKSPIYQICVLAGFTELFHTSDGLVFLYLEDFHPLLTVFQNKTEKEIEALLASSMAEE